MKLYRPKDGEWFAPVMKNFKMGCCDCGLVHDVQFKIDGKQVLMNAERNNRSTAAMRRAMKDNEEPSSCSWIRFTDKGRFVCYACYCGHNHMSAIDIPIVCPKCKKPVKLNDPADKRNIMQKLRDAKERRRSNRLLQGVISVLSAYESDIYPLTTLLTHKGYIK